MGFAASISQRFAILVPTLQVCVSYLRPTPISLAVGRGEVLRLGSATAHLQGELRLPDGTRLASATATAALRPFPRPA